jgi:amidase
MDALCFLSARELTTLIRTRQISAREVMAAHLERIALINPSINAIVSKMDDDRALALADTADEQVARGAELGPLHGLPFAFKDLEDAVGFPATRGSLIYKDFFPTEDSIVVERIRAAGAIAIGKTNVPEFGMGSHTYNRVYGPTRNPYDLTKSAGGSSGGAGAALATGLVPLADGSDLGGSLRNPGNFNNVVGLRPSVGLVPTAPTPLPFVGFSVKGPMARSVADAALLLSVMAGPDPRDPGCGRSHPDRFADPLERDFAGTRVAWCPDLGGLPLDPRVRDAIDGRRGTFEALGCRVEDDCPDLSEADEIFLTLRCWMTAHKYAPLVPERGELMKPEAIQEIQSGSALSGAQVAQAMNQHALLLERVRRFFDQFDFLVCAVNQVPPFDITLDWPTEVAGTRMKHYVEWMKSAYWISTTFGPAISVPGAFTADGLPVGIQLVARAGHDFAVLQLAHAFETATRVGTRRPPAVTGTSEH